MSLQRNERDVYGRIFVMSDFNPTRKMVELDLTLDIVDVVICKGGVKTCTSVNIGLKICIQYWDRQPAE